MNTDKKILNNLIDLGGLATRNNLYSPKAKTHKGSMIQVNNDFRKFVKAGFIQKLEPVIPLRDLWRECFYTITKKGSQYIGREDEYKRGISRVKSPHNVFHESMVRDIALAFINLYPDYSVFIQFDEIFNGLKPDLTVRLVKDGKTYAFLVEIERKKTLDRVRKEKLDHYEKVFNKADLKKLGLPDKFKILVVYATLDYNCFLRPQEYSENKDKIKRQREMINNIVRLSQDLPDYRYRFLSFTDFYRLNEPIWLTPKNNKVNLI